MIRFQVSNQTVIEGLAQLIYAVENWRPAMAAIAGALADEVETAFETEADPVTGAKWPALSEKTTIPAREARGKWPGKILQVSGQLAASWAPESGDDYAAVGTNKIYATTMHFGAARGAFGQTTKGAPIPWGTIPPRPLSPISESGAISDDLQEEILDILQRHISAGQ